MRTIRKLLCVLWFMGFYAYSYVYVLFNIRMVVSPVDLVIDRRVIDRHRSTEECVVDRLPQGYLG
jgi:hypothetical protein